MRHKWPIISCDNNDTCADGEAAVIITARTRRRWKSGAGWSLCFIFYFQGHNRGFKSLKVFVLFPRDPWVSKHFVFCHTSTTNGSLTRRVHVPIPAAACPAPNWKVFVCSWHLDIWRGFSSVILVGKCWSSFIGSWHLLTLVFLVLWLCMGAHTVGLLWRTGRSKGFVAE